MPAKLETPQIGHWFDRSRAVSVAVPHIRLRPFHIDWPQSIEKLATALLELRTMKAPAIRAAMSRRKFYIPSGI
jgi:hypothetical protein